MIGDSSDDESESEDFSLLSKKVVESSVSVGKKREHKVSASQVVSVDQVSVGSSFGSPVETKKLVVDDLPLLPPPTDPNEPKDIGYGMRTAILVRLRNRKLVWKKPMYMVSKDYVPIASRDKQFEELFVAIKDKYDFSRLPPDGGWVYFK